jgi:hypothetical protein
MKTLALLLFLAGGSAALADTDALKNGDFSDGITHWEGNCHTAGSASDDSSATSGVVVNLRSGDWTKINQDFDGKEGNYILTITYIPSPGLTLSQRGEDYQNTAQKMGLAGLPPINTKPGNWCLLLVDTGVNRFTYWELTPTLNASGVQTIKTQVTLKSSDEHTKGFYLGFPPGDGSINLQSITLVPFDGSSS